MMKKRNIGQEILEGIDSIQKRVLCDATRREAETVLLDQRFFVLEESSYEDFLKALEAPPSALVKLISLLEKKAPWDEI